VIPCATVEKSTHTKNSPPAYKEREALFVVKDKATLAKPSAGLVKEINQIADEGVVQGVRILSGEKVVLAFTSKEAKAKWQSRAELKGVLGEVPRARSGPWI
jgi:hypothetical protein